MSIKTHTTTYWAAALVFAGILTLSLFSCSSAPKGTALVNTARNEAAGLLELGARNLRTGQYSTAAGFYAEAYRLYTITDDILGRVRALDGLGRLASYTSIPEVSGLLTRAQRDTSRPAEAAEASADAAVLYRSEDLWRYALLLANDAGNTIAITLAQLLLAELDLWTASPQSLEASLAAAVAAAEKLEKQGKLQEDRARAFRIAGAAARDLGRNAEAIDYLEQAAEIDRKQGSWIEFASNHYLIASVHSRSGAFAEAEAALLLALENDRKMENGPGIAADYQALGQVAVRAGKIEAARLHFLRALDIYNALKMDSRALLVQQRLSELDAR
jgi:tetratricopeptide (TPR) repeat protein